MASAPTETSTEQSSPPTLEELTRRTARGLLLPYIIRYVARAAPSPQSREVVVIFNARTWSMTMIESGVDFETLIRERIGPLPASKASIDAMPVVKVKEERLECAICLAEFDVGEEAKEMPCKHRYHANCIEKWLGIRGSCPMCRYNMPVEEKDSDKTESGNDGADDDGEAEAEAQHEEEEVEEEEEEEEGEEGGRVPTFVFHVYFAGRRVRRQRRYSETETDSDWNSSRGGETGDENSASSIEGMEIDGEPTTAQDMDTDDDTA